MPDSLLASTLADALAAAADLLLPPLCLCCHADVSGGTPGESLCPDCRDKLPLIRWPTCRRCAARLPAAGSATLPCSHCRGVALHFDGATTLGEYRGLLRDLVLRMKTDTRDLLARMAARLVWERLESRLREEEFDVVAAAPMHLWRRWRRRGDAPHAIAEALAPKLGVAAAPGMLRMRRNIRPQIGLSRPARFRNVRGQMAVARGYHLRSARVLLVDDVLTTGATCSEAARTLKAAGAASVTVLTVARTAESS